MRIEFYHVDTFEAANYEPIWRALQAVGVDARLVAIPGSDNTAQEGWFDFERLKHYYDTRSMPFFTSTDYDCPAITTQNESILRHYKSPHIRLSYAYAVYPNCWNYFETTNKPFDIVLVQGFYDAEYISKWKSKDEISIIGYPRYDDFFAGKIDVACYSSKLRLDSSKPTIVYLPTWENRSSIDNFLDQISSLTSEFNVLIKPHHCTLRMEPERMARIARSGLTLVDSAYDLPALFSVGDLVIADTRSGAFFESIMTDTTTIGLAQNPAEIQEWLEPKGVTQLAPICTDSTTLKTTVDKLFENDFYKSARQQWADKHVSFRDGSAAKHAADEIIKLVERKQDNETSKASQISVPVDVGKKKLDFERKKRNIFWICIDGLMAGKLNCCGNTKRPKLFVDELLSRGALFSKVYTAGAGTQTSMHAAFTSMQSASSGTVGWTREALDKIDPNTLSLTDFLKRDGYHTFHYCDGVTPQVVPKSGFDVWETSGYRVGQIIKNTSPTMDCQKRDDFIEQYNQQKGPKFAYLHMHLLHDLNIAFRDIWPTEGYEHNITLLSESLEHLLQKIKIDDDDLLIVSTDHGVVLDKLYVEYERQAGPRHEEVSNLAFYSFINKDLTRCFTDQLFATIDVAPTILDIIGGGAMGAQGQSLLPFILGDTAGYKPAMVFREKGAAYDIPPSPDESNLWCVRTERWKYVTHKSRKDCEWLMDLQNDGDYKKNLIGQGLEIEDVLRKAVHETLIDNPKKPLEIYAENKLEFSRMDIKPVISIVMPVEVATPWLSKSIDSLLTQVGPYYELIILDAEETNYTEQTVLNKYSGRPNVHYHRLEQHLLFELLNFGIESARGDYIALASPQACYEEDFIYELKKRLDRNRGIGLAYSDGKVVREDDCVNGNDTVEDSMLELWSMPSEFVPSVLFSLSLVEKSGLFINEEDLYHQMWQRMAKVTNFAYVPQCLAQYYRIEGQAIGEKLQAQKANSKVSVVLPTYNHLKFLPKAIDSVLSQTYGDFELIIVDDGSTDGTAEYLDALEDPRIQVIHQENKRLPEALNTGFRVARGEYLTWISADNSCVPIYLEAFVAALDANPDVGFAYSAYAIIDEDGQYKDNRERFDVSVHNLITHNAGTASFMYRRTCQEKVGLYDPELEGAEDWDMWLRIVEQFQTVYIPEVLYYYCEHKESMTQKIPKEIYQAGQRVFQKTLKRHNNKFDMMKLYPTISLCKDQKQAKFHACFDFGINVLMWKFVRAELACQMFENALSLFPDSKEAACNLAVAYARLGLQEKVVTLKQAMAEKTDDPKIQDFWHNIIEACHANNPDIFTRKFLFIIDKKLVELFQLEEENKRIFNFTGNAQPQRAALPKCNQGKSKEVEQWFLKMLSQQNVENETKDKLLLGLGDLYIRCERFEDTKKVLEQAVAVEEVIAQEKSEAKPALSSSCDLNIETQAKGLAGNNKVRISVVLATYRRADYLAMALESLSNQTLDRQLYEIIVVDNNSGDNTREVVDRYPSFKYILEEELGLSPARNAGIRASVGDFITFLDDDAEADPNWLKALVETHDNHPDAWVVGGRILLKFDVQPPQWLTESNHRDLGFRDFGDIARELNYPEGLAGSNCSFKRKVFTEIGYFKPQLGRIGNIQLSHEERDIQIHIYEQGHTIYYNPAAFVHHHVSAERMNKAYFANHAFSNFISKMFIRLSDEGRGNEVCQLVNQFRDIARSNTSRSAQEIDGLFAENVYSNFLQKNSGVPIEQAVQFYSYFAKYYLELENYEKAEDKSLELVSLLDTSGTHRNNFISRMTNVHSSQDPHDRSQKIFNDALSTTLEVVSISRDISDEAKISIVRHFCAFHLDSGKYNEAEQMYLKMCSAGHLGNAGKAKLFLGLGDLYSKCGRVEDAKDVLNKAVLFENAIEQEKSLSQSSATTSPDVSDSLSHVRDLSYSIAKKYPAEPEKLTSLADKMYSGNDIEAAVVVLRSCIEIYPEHLNAYLGLSNTFLNQKRLKDAADVMKLAGNATAEAMPHLVIFGNSCQQQGHLAEAKDLYEQALVMSPDESDILSRLGNVCYELGDYRDALNNFQSAEVIEPDKIETLIGLVATASKLGETELFKKAYKQAYALEPTAKVLTELADDYKKLCPEFNGIVKVDILNYQESANSSVELSCASVKNDAIDDVKANDDIRLLEEIKLGNPNALVLPEVAQQAGVLFENIQARSNRLLTQYKNKYQGQRCVIIGNGPSLNNTDLSLLKNEYTFGLNKIYLLFDKFDWRPTFYVAVNQFVIEQSAKQILNEISGLKFLDFVSFKYLPYRMDTIYTRPLNGNAFSTDPCIGVFQAHTVTYVAMQLAYYLGFSEVFLVGVDHFYNAAQKGKPNQVIVQQGADSDHFDSGYFEQGCEWHLPDLKGSEKGYKTAKLKFEQVGKKIYDATVGGHLDVFEKVDFNDVFGKQSRRTASTQNHSF